MKIGRVCGGRALVVLCLALAAAPATAAQTLSVTGSLWSPYIDPELPDGGLAADIVRTALTRAGYQVDAKAENWSRAYQGTAIGIYDVVAAVWRTDAREADLIFSAPYLYNDIVLLARRDALVEFDTLEDLRGHRIGVVRDYAYDEAFDADATLTRVESSQLIHNLLLLRQRKLDLVVDDRWAILHQLSSYLPDDARSFELLPKPLARRGLHLGVSKLNPAAAAIVADFDRAIAGMRGDGSLDVLLRKHTARMSVPPRNP